MNRALGEGGLWREVRVVDETGSTNADVAELARAGEAEGLVLVAEHQSAGRGRLGRAWTSPPQSGLTFSVLLRPISIAAQRWPLVPLLVGVGVARGIAGVADVEVGLKWPNDLMVGDRKLGGILAERVESASGLARGAAIVVGVGLNLSAGESELPVPMATSLALVGAKITDRDTILRASLRGIAAEYDRWVDAGGDPEVCVLPAYRELCVTIGRHVRAELPGGRVIEGSALDVDAAGSLMLETPAGREVVTAGDVVHVR
jgi:BirA family transcriptional regulator, biotin operon repressor / biotin---[acetyl-CoA-carboxylase] ligase